MVGLLCSHHAQPRTKFLTVPRGSTIVTSNLPFDEWTGVFGSERLTGALLDRLTHHVHILEMNGDSYRLKQSKQRQRQT
jgi:DNA replication protein DnaC